MFIGTDWEYPWDVPDTGDKMYPFPVLSEKS